MSQLFTLALPDEVVEAIAQRSAEIVLKQLRDEAGNGSPWLSIAEAAEYLRVSQRQVQRLIARGAVRSMTVGRRRLLHREDLDKAATGEGVAPTTPPRRRAD